MSDLRACPNSSDDQVPSLRSVPTVTGAPALWGRGVYRRGVRTTFAPVLGVTALVVFLLGICGSVLPEPQRAPGSLLYNFTNAIIFVLFATNVVVYLTARYVYEVTSSSGEVRLLSALHYRRSWQKSELGQVFLTDLKGPWTAKRWDGSVLGYSARFGPRRLIGDVVDIYIAPGLTSEQQWLVAHILSVGRRQEMLHTRSYTQS